MPMRYAGPPIFTTSIPTSPSVFSKFVWSICPNPPENMMGLIHSLRSPFFNRWPNDRQYPAMRGSPNLFP